MAYSKVITRLYLVKLIYLFIIEISQGPPAGEFTVARLEKGRGLEFSCF